MKIIGTGDLHFASQRPKNRTDDYLTTQKMKMLHVLNHARSLSGNEEVWVAFPGDVFNSPDAPYQLYGIWASILNSYKTIKVFAVFGQHDLRYRTSRENTPLHALHQSGFIHILDDNRGQYVQADISIDVSIYGASFGDPIPEIHDEEDLNILVVHEMIIDEKLWDGQEEYKLASRILREHPYDLIISGDNHSFFTQSYKGRTLINCGSLMRSTIAQIDHKPKYFVYDIDSREYEIFDIPIEPIEEVMNIKGAQEEKEKDEKIEAFVEGLSEEVEISLDFLKDMNTYLEKNKVDKEITQIIKDCLGEE